MDQEAVQRARGKFIEAATFADELAAMRSTTPRKFFSDMKPTEIDRLWNAFLVAYDAAFDRLLSAAGAGSAWAGNINRERKSDPLLAYLKHARNAELHGLKPITERHDGSAKVVGVDQVKTDRGPLHRLKVQIIDPHILLIDVVDRGVTYQVPTTFRGSAIAEAHPTNVALLGLSRLEELFLEAEAMGDR